MTTRATITAFEIRSIAADDIATQAKESAAALLAHGWDPESGPYDLGAFSGDREALAQRLGHEPTREQCRELERQIRAALTELYKTEYVKEWQRFVQGVTVAEFQDFGDVIGGPLDGALKDPKIAEEAVAWLATRAADVAEATPWFMAVNFVNPHDVMFFDTDAEEMVQVKGMFPIFGAPDTPLYRQKWQTTLPASFFDDLLADARAQVHAAKVALGERGEPWWEASTEAGRRERVEAAILALAGHRAPDGTICPSDAARAVGGTGWRDLIPMARDEARRLAKEGRVEVTQRGERLDPASSWRGPVRIRLTPT